MTLSLTTFRVGGYRGKSGTHETTLDFVERNTFQLSSSNCDRGTLNSELKTNPIYVVCVSGPEVWLTFGSPW